jgi:hypothetical protein
MLAHLRLHGLYLVPGVPNTTHHTQETDQNYGIFKSSFRDNLRRLSQCRFDNGLTLQVCDLPLLIFGGDCPSTGLPLRDAFTDAFSIHRNLSCWKKCGAVPLTMAPLFTGTIRHEVPIGAAAVAVSGEDEDAGIGQLRELDDANKMYCDLLTANGFNGSLLRKEAPTRSTFVAVTEPVSDDRVQAIKAAKTAGQLYYATGGRHLNCDEFFKANGLQKRDVALKTMETRKKNLEKAAALEDTVQIILATKGNVVPENEKNFTVPELKSLLKWKNVQPASNKKADLIAAYYNNPSPPNVERWTDHDEAQLVDLRSKEIHLKDTALAVSATQMARAVMTAVQQDVNLLDPEIKEGLRRALGVDDAIDPERVI